MKNKVCLWLFVIAVSVGFVQCHSDAGENKAKYVFYFIGDGMGINQVNGTEIFRAERKGKIGVEPLNFSHFPVVNYATTYSGSHGVTCSAAAGTALATGEKTKNGTIGMDSLHQNPLYSVAVQAKNAGRAVGIATSVSIDHATPAAFYAHQPNRSMYYPIATDLPKAGFDLYAGAGFLQLTDPKDSLSAEVYTLIQDSGYVLIRGREEFAEKGLQSEKVVWIQEEGKTPRALSYAIDRKEGDLTLAEITEYAIRFLERDKKGFFLMVEGGKIDWACHSNDAATAFREVEDLAEAIQKALDFYQQHPEETLIVITADHETGGIAIGTGKSVLNLKVLDAQRVSKDQLTSEIQALRKRGQPIRWEQIQTLLEEKMGLGKEIILTQAQEAKLKKIYQETFRGGDVKLEQTLYAKAEPLAVEAVKILDSIARIGWTSGGHSAGVVPVFAIGAGADLFTGKLDNTDIPKKIAEAAGYR